MLLPEGCDPLSRLGWYPRTPPPLDPTETSRVLGRHPTHQAGCRVTSRARRRVGIRLRQGDQGRTRLCGSAGSDLPDRASTLGPQSARLSTAEPAREGESRTTAGPRQHNCGFLAVSPTPNRISVSIASHTEPLPRALSPPLRPHWSGPGGGPRRLPAGGQRRPRPGGAVQTRSTPPRTRRQLSLRL